MLLEMKNVMIIILQYQMDVTIVNLIVKMNVLSVYMVNVAIVNLAIKLIYKLTFVK